MSNIFADVGAIAMPDHLSDYANAFRMGRAMATSTPAPDVTLDQLTNAVTGRLAIANGAQRDQAVRRAELLGAIGIGLTRLPYEERAAVLAHLAPALENEGVPSKVALGFDPTDEALETAIGHAHAASALLSAA